MTASVEDLGRRQFLRGRRTQRSKSLRLPWIKSETIFLDQCSQCKDCLDACETKIIKLDDSGFPTIDFKEDECTFCGKCEEVCRQPLFIDSEPRLAKSIRPWPALFNINDKCFAKNQVFCQSCQDVCEVQAIKFKYVDSAIAEPNLDLSACNQCGACVSVCPQQAIAATKIDI
ncbi:ferredoxin-type protein NapF [Thalassotalea fusca]